MCEGFIGDNDANTAFAADADQLRPSLFTAVDKLILLHHDLKASEAVSGGPTPARLPAQMIAGYGYGYRPRSLDDQESVR